MQNKSVVKKRNGEIDVLRFAFSIMIVVHHFCYIYGFKILDRTSRGYIGVEFFFLVTGFLMAKTASKICEQNQLPSAEIANHTWKFVVKKIRVFFTCYIVAYAIQLVAKIFVFDWTLQKTFEELLCIIPIQTFSFVGVIANSNLYISGHWYLSAMVIALFILYPILLKNYHLSTKVWFPLISIFLIGHMYHNYSQVIMSYTEYTFASTGLIRAVIEIAMGASLHELIKIVDRKKPNMVLMTAIKLFAYGVVLLYAYGFTGRDFDIHALLWCAVAVGLSFSNVTYSIPGNGFTNYLGKISLPIYIFHTIFMRCSVEILGESIGLRMLIMLIILSVVFSLLIMYIIDFICQCIKRYKVKAAS